MFANAQGVSRCDWLPLGRALALLLEPGRFETQEQADAHLEQLPTRLPDGERLFEFVWRRRVTSVKRTKSVPQ